MPKALTVGTILDDIHDLQLRQSVYVHVLEYLKQFVSTDSYTPVKGIKSLAYVEDAVPEEVVDAVMVEIEEIKSGIEGRISKLREQRLPDRESPASKRRKP
jgi:hypothetical protein